MKKQIICTVLAILLVIFSACAERVIPNNNNEEAVFSESSEVFSEASVDYYSEASAQYYSEPSVDNYLEANPDYYNYSQEIPYVPSLEDISFGDLQGIDRWIGIDGYSSKGYIELKARHDHVLAFCDVIFQDGYFSAARIRGENASIYKSVTYDFINPNVIRYYDKGEEVLWEITDRVILDEEKGWIVLKTRRGRSAVWFVPANIVDWSIEREHAEGEGADTIFRYYLK